MSQGYVVGFCIVPSIEHVLLIQKNRPEFQAGKWNGIGGKMERDERPIQSMVREFREECGVSTTAQDWTHTITFHGHNDQANPGNVYWIHYYRMFADKMPDYRTTTDEKVAPIYYRHGLWDVPTLDNMRWIFPIQLNRNLVFPLQLEWSR